MRQTTGSTVRMHAVIRGLVQGVGYRWFVQNTAASLDLAGWVKNLHNGDVEVEAEGDREDIERFLSLLRSGHSWARVDSIDTEFSDEMRRYEEFEIKF